MSKINILTNPILWKIIHLLKNVGRFLILSHLIIAIEVLAFTQSALILLQQTTGTTEYAVVFFGTFCTYNLNIFYKISPQSYQFNFIEKNRKLIQLLFFISLIFLLIAVTQLTIYQFLFLIHLAIFSFFYTVSLRFTIPFTNKQLYLKALRQIPYLKIFLIAYVWTITTVVFPIFDNIHQIDLSKLIGLAIARFLFVIAITFPFDVRDLYTDKANHIYTISGKVGITRARNLSFACLLLHTIINIANYPFYHSFPMTLTAIVAALLVYYATPQRHPFYFALIDGLFIVQFLILWGFERFYF